MKLLFLLFKKVHLFIVRTSSSSLMSNHSNVLSHHHSVDLVSLNCNSHGVRLPVKRRISISLDDQGFERREAVDLRIFRY